MTSASNAIIFSLLLLAALLAPATAGPLEDATNAYIKGDYPIALQLIRPLAERGNAVAQHNLGLMYADGRGVAQDDAEALKWYRLAAEQGFAPSQTNLGLMYADGKGVLQDDAEALKWYRLAANQGYAIGQYNLGVRYREGLGVPRDNVRAYMWFLLAKEYGLDPEPMLALAVTSLDMNSSQIAEAEKLAREWKPIKQAPPQSTLPGAV
jgi:TPR repeat protein